jgi:hypothetical protein
MGFIKESMRKNSHLIHVILFIRSDAGADVLLLYLLKYIITIHNIQ